MTSPSQLREWAELLFVVALTAKDASLTDELTARAIGYLDEANVTADPAELPPSEQTERVVRQQQQQQGQRLMTRTEEYRQNAKAAEEQAAKTNDFFAKDGFLEVARQYRLMAEQVERQRW